VFERSALIALVLVTSLIGACVKGEATPDTAITADAGDAQGTDTGDAQVGDTGCTGCVVDGQCVGVGELCPNDSDPLDCTESRCAAGAPPQCGLFPAAAAASCGAPGCGGTCTGEQGATCDLGDDPEPGCANVNLIFTSSTTAPVDSGLGALDAHCAERAEAASLPGTRWVAWASAAGTGNKAWDRLNGASGWVRVGDHRPVAATVQDLRAGELLFPPLTDETGTEVTHYLVATGTRADGAAGGANCGGWNSAEAVDSLVIGHVGAGSRRWTEHEEVPCDTELRVVCLQADFEGSVSPPSPPVQTRRAFVSAGSFSAGDGVAAADALCQAEAGSGAAPPGTYRAFLATNNASPLSRMSDGPPWARADGLIVFGTSDPGVITAPLAQQLDGTFTGAVAWVGTTDPTGVGSDTCSDWENGMGQARPVFSGFGHSDWLGVRADPQSCGVGARLWCLQDNSDPVTGCVSNGDCDDGLTCTVDSCTDGTCVHALQSGFCAIPGTGCVTSGTLAPTGECQACNPATSTSSWSEAMNGTPCDDGDAATTDDMCDAGACVGTGAQACTSSLDCQDGVSCTDDICTANGCSNPVNNGCLIGGLCFLDGEVNADNACLSCDSAINPNAWTGSGCANLAFTLSSTVLPTFLTLGAADQLCNDAAPPGLSGEFVAWLSSTEATAESRIPMSARGWVRADGLPVADQRQALLEGRFWYPPVLDAMGAEPFDANTTVWTGTTLGGGAASDTCANWTMADAGTSGVVGIRGAAGELFTSAGEAWCSDLGALLCLQTTINAPVSLPPAPANAWQAFVSSPIATLPDGGISALDAHCQADAAGLSGTFQAFVAPSGASASSRFTPGPDNWYDPTGVQITASPSDIASADARLLGALWRDATGGEVPSYDYVMTGAMTPDAPGSPGTTCNNWLDPSGNGNTTRAGYTEPGWMGDTLTSCSNFRVYCFQSGP